MPSNTFKDQPLVPARFYLDDILPDGVDGFTRGGSWNGWSCPLFDRKGADRVMAYMTMVMDESCPTFFPDRPYYDAERDCYGFPSEDYPDEPLEYGGFDVDGLHLYPIGSHDWVWTHEVLSQVVWTIDAPCENAEFLANEQTAILALRAIVDNLSRPPYGHHRVQMALVQRDLQPDGSHHEYHLQDYTIRV